MTNTIPVSQLVSSTPSVLGAGGIALVLNGLALTASTRVPIGSVLSFPSQAAVGAYFGLSSAQYTGSGVYFGGFSTSTIKPGSILYAQFNEANVAGYLRGGSLASMTLAQLTALSGTIILTVAGTPFTSSTITLSGATSFSNAATIIQAAFTSPTFTVTFDSVASAFVFTTDTTGATETITYATGTLSASLLLTQGTGAVTSQGAAAATPASFMAGIIGVTTNFVDFFTDFDPDNGSGNTQKQAFAAWANSTGNRYAYIAWDTDITPTESTTATTSLGNILETANSSGTAPIYAPINQSNIAYFVSGAIASINVNATNGRITLAYKSQQGLVADVTSATVAANLIANSYNFYGIYNEVNNNFTCLQTGSVTGQYLWLDSYINQIFLNSQFRLALMTLLTNVNTVPYGDAGSAMIDLTLATPIAQFGNFGGFSPGEVLSGSQIAAVNAAAGNIDVATTLQNRGWYLQVLNGTAQQRAARSTPPINFWYVDGGSIQVMNVASIEVQ